MTSKGPSNVKSKKPTTGRGIRAKIRETYGVYNVAGLRRVLGLPSFTKAIVVYAHAMKARVLGRRIKRFLLSKRPTATITINMTYSLDKLV
jgi:hypothetical protein